MSKQPPHRPAPQAPNKTTKAAQPAAPDTGTPPAIPKANKPAQRPATPPKKSAVVHETGTIDVVATKAGYHDLIYRKPGDRFTLRPVKGAKVTLSAEDQFSDEWMRRAGDPEPEAPPAAPEVFTSAGEAADAKDPTHTIPRNPNEDELPL